MYIKGLQWEHGSVTSLSFYEIMTDRRTDQAIDLPKRRTGGIIRKLHFQIIQFIKKTYLLKLLSRQLQKYSKEGEPLL